MCSTSVSLGYKEAVTEFYILAQSVHHVMLGVDFLCDSGANIDCATAEISIYPRIISILTEHPTDSKCYLIVNENYLLPLATSQFIRTKL